MNIFAKRPLSLILCIALGGFVLFNAANPAFKLLLIISSIVLICSFFVLVFIKTKKPSVLICGVTLLLSTILSQLYFNLWFFADQRIKGEATVVGTVIEEEQTNIYTTRYVVKTENINELPFSKYKLEFYLKNEEKSLTVGSKVSFKCDIAGYQDYESKNYKYGQGLSAKCENVSELSIFDGTKFVFKEWLSTVREKITRHAIMLSNEETGSFVSALLLGERDALNQKTILDFKRIGISHILALSGMQLAILAFGIEKLLSLLQFNKKITVGITAIFTLIYMFFTGLSPSVCRAGLMLILSSILYFLSRDKDGITSLFVAVSVILLFAPYLIFDVSLWLSAFATLGILIYNEWKVQNRNKKLKNKIYDAIAFSCFAITATLFISHFTFNGISLVSIFTTPIFSILSEIIIYLGTFMLIFGSIIPIGKLLIPIVNLVFKAASTISQLDVFVSKDYLVADLTVVLLSILFVSFAILKFKRKTAAVISIIGCLSILYILLGILHFYNKQNEKVVYFNEEANDEIVIISDNKTTLVSSSKYSEYSGYFSVGNLTQLKLSTLDNYIVPNYTKTLDSHISSILSQIKIKEIHLPKPRNKDEEAILKGLEIIAKENGSCIILYEKNQHIKVGNFEFIPVYSVTYGEGTMQNAFFIHSSQDNILYLSSGMLEESTANIANESIAHSNKVIFGSHGKKHKSKVYFSAEYNALDAIIFNTENLFIKQKALSFYDEKGCEIYSHPRFIVLFD